MAFTNQYNVQDSLPRSHKIHLSVIRILDSMFAALRERKMKRNCFREKKKPWLIRVNFIEFRFFPIIAKSVRDVVNSGKEQNIHVYETKIAFVLFAQIFLSDKWQDGILRRQLFRNISCDRRYNTNDGHGGNRRRLKRTLKNSFCTFYLIQLKVWWIDGL